MFFIRVDGMNRVRNSLRKLAALDRNVLEPESKKWAQSTAKRLKSTKYPPKRPNQKYRRTGRLANSWKVENPKPGVVNITNTARYKGTFYAGYVVGDDQAWMHAGRWWQARNIVKGEIPQYTQGLTRKIESVWQNG